jgi:hypothetical protein
MNMGEYGGKLQRLGLQNMDELANLENQRRWAQYAADQENSQAQGKAVGALVGGLAGGVKGYYNKKREDHTAKQAERRAEYEQQNTRDYVNARMEGRTPDEPEPFRPETFDFMTAMKKDLSDIGWIDP